MSVCQTKYHNYTISSISLSKVTTFQHTYCQAFSFETGHFCPSKCPIYLRSLPAICGPPRRQMAKRRRLAGPLYLVNLMTFGPSIAHLLNAARAIFGLPGIFK